MPWGYGTSRQVCVLLYWEEQRDTETRFWVPTLASMVTRSCRVAWTMPSRSGKWKMINWAKQSKIRLSTRGHRNSQYNIHTLKLFLPHSHSSPFFPIPYSGTFSRVQQFSWNGSRALQKKILIFAFSMQRNHTNHKLCMWNTSAWEFLPV